MNALLTHQIVGETVEAHDISSVLNANLSKESRDGLK
jgi:hypothetical protein